MRRTTHSPDAVSKQKQKRRNEFQLLTVTLGHATSPGWVEGLQDGECDIVDWDKLGLGAGWTYSSARAIVDLRDSVLPTELYGVEISALARVQRREYVVRARGDETTN